MSQAKFEGDQLIGGVWCHQVLEMLEAYVEGTLSAAQLGRLQAHVSDCHACASFGQSYGHLVEVIRSGLEEEQDGSVFERLSERLADVG